MYCQQVNSTLHSFKCITGNTSVCSLKFISKENALGKAKMQHKPNPLKFACLLYVFYIDREDKINLFYCFRISRIVEAGLIDKWTELHWPTSTCRGQGTFAEVSPVNLQGFLTVIFVLVAGIGLATCVLVLEHLWNNCSGLYS